MRALRASRLGVVSRRLLALLLLALSGVVATPSTARAHAHLRRSAPAAGSTVVSPTAIRLWFSETPELALTRITVADSTGAIVAIGALEVDPDGAMGVRVRVDSVLAAGRYTVRWSTAAADGHPSSGTFTFRVAAASGSPPSAPSDTSARLATSAAGTPRQTPAARAAAAPAAPPEVSSDTVSVQPAAVVTRAAWLAVIVMLVGAVAFRLLILARTDAFDANGRSAAAAYLAGGAMIVCALFLIATVARLYLQTRLMAVQLSASPAPVHALLMDTGWGRVWRLQLVAGILALFGLVAARQRLPGGWAVAAFAAILIAAGAALSGHAAASEHLRAFAVADDTVHVIGAAGWLGGLFWVVVIGTTFPLDAGEGAARRLASLVSAFSPVALWCSALVALSGVASGWLRLGGVSALWTTSYGAVLLLKLALVAVAGGIGFYNWRRIRPVLGTDVATARLRRSATMELAVGGAIVLMTAVLVGLPTPVPGVR